MSDQKHHNWAAIGGTVGGLLGASATAFMSGQQVDVASHWALAILGATGFVAALAGAFLAAIKTKA